KCSEYYFEDLVSEMKNELLRSEVLHADETTFKVLADKDRQKSYMWLFSAGKYAEKPIHIYRLGPSRGAEVPKAFLEGYQGYLHSDVSQLTISSKGLPLLPAWHILDATFMMPDQRSTDQTVLLIK